MNSTLEVKGSQTTMRNQNPSWDVFLLSTSLFIYGLDQGDINRKLMANQNLKSMNAVDNGMRSFYGSPPSAGTILSFDVPIFSIASTTLNQEEEYTEDYDVAIKPIFREFKIQVTSFKLDKSLPRIYAD